MINLFEWDNANVDGNKEAVVVPNVPTLINKLIANEANNIRNKINEIIPLVNTVNPIPYYELRLKAKGEGNTASELQIGDVVEGFASPSIYWKAAIYNGGDPTDRTNYTEINNTHEPQLFTALSTGVNQTFILNPSFKAGSVYKSKGLLYEGSEWTQTDDVLTILINTNTGNTIYVTT